MVDDFGDLTRWVPKTSYKVGRNPCYEDWDFQKHMQGHHFDLHMSFPSGSPNWIHHMDSPRQFLFQSQKGIQLGIIGIFVLAVVVVVVLNIVRHFFVPRIFRKDMKINDGQFF